jgi:hypothetical protein
MEARVLVIPRKVLSMFRQLFPFLPLVVAGVFPVAHAATLNCVPSAARRLYVEKGSRRTGDLVFNCSGGGAERHPERGSLPISERQHHQPS